MAWAYIDTDVLLAARKAKGLSYEGVARMIPISSKTYERWEKAGRVPRELVDRIADLLDLEIERPARVKASVRDDEDENEQGEIAALRSEMKALRRDMTGQLAAIFERLPEPSEPDQPREEEG